MAVPDLDGYHDLILFDRDPIDIAERGVLDATVKMPGVDLRPGNVEVTLLDAIALEVAELVYAINRLPSATVDVLMRLFGITRDPGAPATTTVTFTFTDDDGHELPAGLTVRLEVPGSDPLDFTSDTGLVVPAGSTSGTVDATARSNTAAANGIAAGTEGQLLDSAAYVDSAVLASVVTDGADPEDDAAWRDRAIIRFSRLTSTLVRPEHFTAAALEDPAVARATTVDLYDPAAGPPGSDPGHTTVAVLGANGALLSAGAKTAIEATLEASAHATLDVHVIDPTVTNVPVTVTVHRLPGFDDATVKANVVAALQEYLSSDTWGWSATVRRNELIALIDGAPGVDYVVTLTAPAADVTLTGAAPLADTDVDAADVTVTAP